LEVRAAALRSGNTKSCGCIKRSNPGRKPRANGGTHSWGRLRPFISAVEFFGTFEDDFNLMKHKLKVCGRNEGRPIRFEGRTVYIKGIPYKSKTPMHAVLDAIRYLVKPDPQDEQDAAAENFAKSLGKTDSVNALNTLYRNAQRVAKASEELVKSGPEQGLEEQPQSAPEPEPVVEEPEPERPKRREPTPEEIEAKRLETEALRKKVEAMWDEDENDNSKESSE
jgi:hypothetical protein